MPVTGNVWNDINGDGIKDASEPYMEGLRVTLTETVFVNGFSGEAFTDASGFFSIDSTGMVGANYHIRVWVSDEWTPVNNNDYDATIGGNDYIPFPFISRCTRVVSSWLTKVCFIPDIGVRVTFKSGRHDSKLFTCIYPGTTMQDYLDILSQASKGRWIHWFYEKKRVYIPWPVSP